MCSVPQSDTEGEGGSGRKRAPEPRYLIVGRVLRPHGVKGELRVQILTAYPERLAQHSLFYLRRAGARDPIEGRKVERQRRNKQALLLKLEGCDDRNAAEAMRGMLVQIPIEDAVPLDDGEHYLYQLVGLSVETEAGENLGEVVDVIETGANDVYVVRGPDGELLIPAVEDVVRELDVESGRLVVRLPPGLRDEGE
ncbi:MAG: 16S rRNA processing protein RimM [Anaerolineales bacterium]|nr:MAG: 16S rRNA processing protein RimM [Anaerolineales bacterium]